MTTDLTKLPEGWKPADLRNAIDEVKASNAAHARLIAAAPTMFDYIAARAKAGDEQADQIVESIHAGS